MSSIIYSLIQCHLNLPWTGFLPCPFAVKSRQGCTKGHSKDQFGAKHFPPSSVCNIIIIPTLSWRLEFISSARMLSLLSEGCLMRTKCKSGICSLCIIQYLKVLGVMHPKFSNLGKMNNGMCYHSCLHPLFPRALDDCLWELEPCKSLNSWCILSPRG